MINVRKSAERGHFRSDWLDSRHTFSFDTYQDPDHMGFRTLRVINEDRVAAGKGFPLHPHQNMEILTFIIEGELQHRDDLGNEEIIRAGEVQRITAGTGIRHSEFNPSAERQVHLLQIWILPGEKGLEPGYETRRFTTGEKNRLQRIASPDSREGSALLHQDAHIFAGTLESGRTLDYVLSAGRHGWIQVISGELSVNGGTLRDGDGAAVSEEAGLRFEAGKTAGFLLFDLN